MTPVHLGGWDHELLGGRSEGGEAADDAAGAAGTKGEREDRAVSDWREHDLRDTLQIREDGTATEQLSVALGTERLDGGTWPTVGGGIPGRGCGQNREAASNRGLNIARTRADSRGPVRSNDSDMKKPTRKRREWNARHARGLFRRKLVHKEYLKAKHRRKGSRPEAPRIDGRRPTVSIRCPKVMSLAENFDGVTRLLKQIRGQSTRQRGEMVYINFKEIDQISAGAALVVAAELDRWNHIPHHQGRKLRAVDVEEWDEDVRHRLKDMGFFDLLHVRARETDEGDPSGTKYVRFRSGRRVEGKAIEDLRTLDLEPFFGDSVPNRRRLYAAVTEAMTNVVHHAYRDKAQTVRPNWWLAASHNAQAGEVRILLYDQGEGIPRTLPRRFGERIRQILQDRVRPTDADMVRAAHELTRTASGQSHRGHGLQRDVRKYAEAVGCTSAYRVTSLRGQYTWERQPGERARESEHNYMRSLPGTLIEWRLTLQ